MILHMEHPTEKLQCKVIILSIIKKFWPRSDRLSLELDTSRRNFASEREIEDVKKPIETSDVGYRSYTNSVE